MRPARTAAGIRLSQDILGALTMAPDYRSKSHACSYNPQYHFYINYLHVGIALDLIGIFPRAVQIYKFSSLKTI